MAGWGCKVKTNGISGLIGFMRELKHEVLEPAISHLADDIRDQLIASIDQGRSEWPPLSEVTKWLKGSDQMLVNTGDFKNSIQVEKDGAHALIGVLVPRGSKGQDMELIARVIEGGATIPVTDKMRKWFAAKGKPLRKTTAAIIVPARPIFNPSIRELDDRLDEVFGLYLDKFVSAASSS